MIIGMNSYTYTHNQSKQRNNEKEEDMNDDRDFISKVVFREDSN